MGRKVNYSKPSSLEFSSYEDKEREAVKRLPESNARIGRVFASNIATESKPIQLELFEKKDITAMKKREGENYVNESHRPIELTYYQKKLALFLSYYLSPYLKDKDITDKVNALKIWVEFAPKVARLGEIESKLKQIEGRKRTPQDEKSKEIRLLTVEKDRLREEVLRVFPDKKAMNDTFNTANNDIKRYVSFRELSKMIHGKSTAEYMDRVGEELKKLSQVYCPIVYTIPLRDNDGKALKDKKGNTIYAKRGKYEPLITIAGKIVANSGDDDEVRRGAKLSKEVCLGVDINFNSVFFYNVLTEFAFLTPKLMDILRNKVPELFLVLLFDLCAKMYNKWVEANIKKREVEKMLNGRNYKNKKEEQKNKILREEIDKALTYDITDETIKSKVDTDYSSTRQYRSNYENVALPKSVGLLIEYGIVKEVRRQEIKNAKGKVTAVKRLFVFNYDFAKTAYGEEETMGAREESGAPLPPSRNSNFNCRTI